MENQRYPVDLIVSTQDFMSCGWKEVLEQTAVGLATDGSAEENWFNEVVRPQFKR